MIRSPNLLFAFYRAVLWLIALSGVAYAQSTQTRPEGAPGYPWKSVRIIVAFAPGGGTDIIARLLGQKVGEMWGQSVVVENQGGGGTVIGTDYVVRSAPDGHTMLLSGGNVAYISALYRKLAFDVTKDLAPVLLVASQPSMLAVHPSLPVKSVTQLIALAKLKPGEILYSSGGSGSASHFAAELFRSTAGIKLLHVPYKGAGPATIALIAGEVHMLVTNMASLLPHMKSGRARALAVTGATRTRTAPQLPTLAEAGLPGCVFDGWYGLLVPARTPAAILRKINEDSNRALAAPDLVERLADAGIEPMGGTQEKFAAYLAAEITKWRAVVREAGIVVD